MPLYHCRECHHEWEGAKTQKFCSWCGAEGYILEDKTPLEHMCGRVDVVLSVLKELKEKWEKERMKTE
jgi:hypothetical protein